jgi:hypothetical protein
MDWAEEQSKAIVARIVKWLEDDSRPATELFQIWDQVATALRTAERRGIESVAQWRHKKRGTTYTEIGRARLQQSGQFGPTEGDELVIYRSDTDGSLWARATSEFMDGRFEALAAPPADAAEPPTG